MDNIQGRTLLFVLFLLLLFGCTKRWDGVYIDESGKNYLIACTLESSPNGEELLWCSQDQRGTW